MWEAYLTPPVIENVLSVVSFFALMAAARLVMDAWRVYVGVPRALLQAKEQKLDEVLESSDIAVVGGYLDEVIGGFSVYEYATADRVAAAVDRYLDKLNWFVSTDADIARAAELAGGATEPEGAVSMSDELKTALHEVRWGEVWNGLARLRREIETGVRSIATRRGLWADKTSSAGLHLTSLLSLGLISKEDADSLASALAVCNEGIHGGDVLRDEAERAVKVAAAVLGRLNPPLGPEA